MDWLNTPLDTSVAEIIARKRRGKLIEDLRLQLQGRSVPSVQVRLQLCDLLIQADRGREAVPVLLGLADEFASDGFVAKAVAILKRVEKMDPGPHVDSRLERLVGQQQRYTPVPGRPLGGSASPSPSREMGMEEFGAEPPPVEVEPQELVVAAAEPGAVAVVEPESVAVVQPDSVADVELARVPEAESVPVTQPEAEIAAEPAGAELSHAVGDDVTAAEPGAHEGSAEPAPTAPGETRTEADGTVAPASPGVDAAAPAAVEPFEQSFETAGPAAGDTASVAATEADVSAPSTLVERTTSLWGQGPQAPEPVAPPEPDAAPGLDAAVPLQPDVAAAGDDSGAAAPADSEHAPAPAEPEAAPAQDHVAPEGDAPPQPADVGETAPPAEAGPATDAATPAPEATPAAAGMAKRIRGVFRRFLSSLPGRPVETRPAPEPEAASDATAPQPTTDAAPAAEDASSAAPGSEAVAEPATVGEPGVDATSEAAASVDESAPAADVSAEPAPSVTDAQPAVEIGAPTVDPGAPPAPLPAGVESIADAEGGASGEATAASHPEGAVASEPAGESASETPVEVGSDTPGVAVEAPAAAAVAEPAFAAGAEPAVEVEATEVTVEPSPEPVAATLPAEPETSPVDQLPQSEPADTIDESTPSLSAALFEEQLLDLVTDVLHRPQPPPKPPAAIDRTRVLEYAQRLLATPLFGTLGEEELLAVMQGLRLQLFGAGDVVMTEGEPGHSLFILATGTVKVFVRNPDGRNFVVSELGEGEFFGEIASLSGRPRTATIVAAAPCELLELDAATLERIAQTHPRVCDVLESFYIQRASSPEAAAVRAVPMRDGDTNRKAIEVLEAHFGETRWEPRMRLRLADLLLKSGKDQDAIPILVGLADELAQQGFPEKAVAILKKIEQVQRRGMEEVNLAPLKRAEPARAPAPILPAAPQPPAPTAAVAPSASPRRVAQRTDEYFSHWLVDVVRDTVERRPGTVGVAPGVAAPAAVRAYGPGLLASPLFGDFTEDELLAFIQGLQLLSYEPGDVIVTEGEPGQSLFILTTGGVKVFVRSPSGRNVPLCDLGEGAFFGEVATLSGAARNATVIAASACELLELDRTRLEQITAVHPRVRQVLEEFSALRSQDPSAAAIRSGS